MIKYLIFSFLLISCVVGKPCLTAQQESTCTSVKDKLANIPKEDFQALHQLFHYLVFDNYFAYTLFDAKPMTHKGVLLSSQPYSKVTARSSDQLFLRNWEVWKKYSKEFTTPNYVFLENHLPGCFEIHFLNKNKTLQCINENIEIFKKILGNEITSEKLWCTILSTPDIYDAIGKSQILYGILFGFGLENAKGYYDKYELGLPLPNPKPFHVENTELNLLPLPYFSIFYPSEQTKSLKDFYKKERERILKIYSEGNFLEITLAKLLS